MVKSRRVGRCTKSTFCTIVDYFLKEVGWNVGGKEKTRGPTENVYYAGTSIFIFRFGVTRLHFGQFLWTDFLEVNKVYCLI